MDDQKRTKLLGAVLAAVVAVWFGRPIFTNWLFGPVRDLERKLAAARAENENLADQDLQLGIAQRNLSDWRFNSLPANIDDAQRLYREWIFSLARECGFSGSSFEVTPGSRSPQKEFSTVSVDVKKAETDLNGLARFLYLFDQAGLMHRIFSIKIDSPGAQGNPRLVVSFTAEGMSVAGSEDKRELLPRTPLTAPLSDSAQTLTVAPSELFPSAEDFEPFWIHIERELIKVTAITENGWQIERGFANTKPAPHPANTPVELFPVAWDRRDKSTSDYQNLIANSPFVIPSPPKTFSPRIAGLSDKTIRPGEEVKLTARAENANPELGTAVFALKDAAAGMTINPESGEFLWQPPAELPPGKYSATIVMHQASSPETTFDSQLNITIRQPNAAPKVELPKSAVVVLGREFTVQTKASDDGPANSLKYSLGGGAPEGLAIDPNSGLVRWTPARSFTPGKYELTVKATDSGDSPQSASTTITLDVQDDHAATTLLTGTVSRDGTWYAWLRNKATGVTAKLKVGEFVRVSEIDAEITAVNQRFINLTDSEGTWKLELGQLLRDRLLVQPAPPKPDTEDEPAAEPAAEPTNPAEPMPSAEQPSQPSPAPKEPAPQEPTPDTPGASE